MQEKQEKITGVYFIENKINGKKYIGSAVDIGKRWLQHRRALRNDRHINSYLQRAWNKDGESNFELKIDYKCDDKQVAQLLEQLWFDYYFIFAKAKRYDIYNLSDRASGGPMTDENKAKLRKIFADPVMRAKRLEAQLKVLNSPEEKARRDARNKSPELRTKRSAIQRVVQNKPEVNDKRIRSCAITNAKPEVKALRSAKAKEINSRPAVLEKNRAKNKTIQNTPEMKELHSKAARGSNNRHAKLTENDVLEIRKLTSKYNISNTSQKKELINELGTIYDVTSCAIERVILQKTWKHI